MEMAVVKVDETTAQEFNLEENITAIKRDIDYIRSANAEYAIRVGNRLNLIKENVPHGKWLETIGELDFTPRQAQRLMKIAETFGNDPEVLAGMSQRRAYSLTTLPEENLIQLKHDGLVLLPDGTTFTLAEFSEMNGKEFENKLINLRNKKNAEIREASDRAYNAEQELKSTRKEAEEREEFLQNFIENKDAAVAEKLKNLNKLLADIDAEKNKLKLELMDKNQEQFAEEECLEAIAAAKKALNDLFFMLQNVRVGYNRKLRAELVGYVHWLGEHAHLFDVRLQNFIDEELNNDSKIKSA